MVDDVDGITEQLDANMQKSVDDLLRPLAGRPRPGDRSAIPHIATAAPAPSGAGAMRDVVVGSVEDIPVREGRTFAVDGEQIAVFRLQDGSLRAIDAICPHNGGPLADGLADDRVVVCPLHGHTFDICIQRPAAT